MQTLSVKSPFSSGLKRTPQVKVQDIEVHNKINLKMHQEARQDEQNSAERMGNR